jgi:hypothetical protein
MANGAATKLRSAPIFVSASAVPSGNAAVAKKSDTVKPIDAPEGQEDGRRHQSAEQRERQRPRRVERGKDHQAHRVIGDRDEQQKGNRRVA